MGIGKRVKRKIVRQFRHGIFDAWLRHVLATGKGKRHRLEFFGDGLGVRNRDMTALREPRFATAYEEARRLNADGWSGKSPDILWRAHVACWAAKHALTIEGDFVECGVHTGLLSRTICGFLDFAKVDRQFWLFDTWAGIPTESATADEARMAAGFNKKIYAVDSYPIARRNFAAFPNVRLVRGVLPGSLAQAEIGAISYLSIDLNSAAAERGVIEALWGRLSRGAVVLLDDYGFTGFSDQHDVWDAFAADVGTMVATLPTGQGLIVRGA